MPPRFAYWTILIDGNPTAFRARDPQELQPTITQLKRTNQDVAMKWFARGKLWESPEAERSAERRPAFTGQKGGGDWRAAVARTKIRAIASKRSTVPNGRGRLAISRCGTIGPGAPNHRDRESRGMQNP